MLNWSSAGRVIRRIWYPVFLLLAVILFGTWATMKLEGCQAREVRVQGARTTDTVYVDRPVPQRLVETRVQPVERTIYTERVVTVVDTIEVPVELEESGYTVASTTPVEVVTPLLGRQRVNYTYFNVDSLRYETATYDVPKPPVSYGVELEGSATYQMTDPRVSLRGYVGYRGVEPFAGVEFGGQPGDPLAPGAQIRVGVRYRLGR